MNNIYFSEIHFEKSFSPAEVKVKQSEYCKSIISEVVCQEFGLKREKVVFLTDTHGKPYLNGNYGLHFNISHTKSAVAVAISDKPVGIDIELIRTANMKLATKMFSDPEVSYITELPHETDKRFYEIWTRKEAYAKYLGTGIFMQIPLKAFNTLNPETNKYISSVFIGEYVVSVCSKYDLREFSFEKRNMNDK